MSQEWKEYRDDDRIEEELISSSKFEHYKSKDFNEILLEDTASLDIEVEIETVSASFENTIFKSVNTGRTIKDSDTDEVIAIQYLTAKVFIGLAINTLFLLLSLSATFLQNSLI